MNQDRVREDWQAVSDEDKKVEFSIEKLYHFSCRRCRKWWTIGDMQTLMPTTTVTCPHCGNVHQGMKLKR